MKFLLKLVATLVLVGVIVWRLGDLGEVGELMARIDPRYALLIFTISTLDRALMTFKWGQLLRSRGLNLPFFRGLQIYCASMVWGLFLPATVGADALRAFSTSRIGLDANEVVASIVIERIVGFFSALLMGQLGLAFLFWSGMLDNRFNLVWWLGSAMMVGATVAFTVSFSQSVFDILHDRLLYRFRELRLVRRLRQFHTIYRAYQNDGRSLTVFFALTFGEQFLLILHAWLVAQSLGIKVGLLYIAGAVPLAFLIARLPVSINGIGIFDGAFMMLMSLAGVPGAEAIAIVLMGRILGILSWLPWWAAHVLNGGTRLQLPRPLAEVYDGKSNLMQLGTDGQTRFEGVDLGIREDKVK